MFISLNKPKMSSSLKPSFPKLICTSFLIIFFAFALPQLCKAQIANNTNQPVFNHAALCAKNLKKTADFYRKVIQLQEIPHPFKDTVHVWLKIGEGLALHIIQGECPTKVHDIGIHICFSVPNLDAFIHHLDEMNVPYSNWTGQPKKIQLRTVGLWNNYIPYPYVFWF
jgi:lactoylglutathione lyase